MRVHVALAMLAAGCAHGPTALPQGAPPGPSDAVPRGTLAGAQLRQPLSSAASAAGDRFTLELLDPLVDASGRERVARGAIVEGEVRRTGASGVLDLAVLGVRGPGGLEPLGAELASLPVERAGAWRWGLGGGLAGAAAGTGAALAIDADQGAAVAGGAIIGAAVGGLVGWWLGRGDLALPSGSVVTLRVVDGAQTPP
jgi:hypothetical protein